MTKKEHTVPEPTLNLSKGPIYTFRSINLYIVCSLKFHPFKNNMSVAIFTNDKKKNEGGRQNYNFFVVTYYMSVTHNLYHFRVC